MYSINDALLLNGLYDGYKPSEQDLENPLGTSYYGFLQGGGKWYILKQVTSGTITTYRYTKGTTGYATNWTNRASLSYDLYSAIWPS